MSAIYIVGAARTPIGAFAGGLKDIPAHRLGSIAIGEALRRAGIAPDFGRRSHYGLRPPGRPGPGARPTTSRNQRRGSLTPRRPGPSTNCVGPDSRPFAWPAR